MEPEEQPAAQQKTALQGEKAAICAPAGTAPAQLASVPSTDAEELPYHGLRWIFVGSEGLRAGWSVLVFMVTFGFLVAMLGTVFVKAHWANPKGGFTPSNMFFNELVSFLAMLAAVGLMAVIEGRGLLDYNLRGPRRPSHFFFGLASGFLALSALIGSLAWGHWLTFGPVALSGAVALRFGALWACVFLLVGCVEEGTFRCYLQSTLTRGINFWWALGAVGLMCSILLWRAKGNGVWGVYAAALLGLAPCLWLHIKRASGAGFWQAAWVTSTLFAFVHTGNGGENWIGIFHAAVIAFVFCVSIRVTGSAWWAIGCHAGWDWAETYFYGTADSGFVAQGHYLSTTPAGSALWSGGSDGPEGSLIALAIILLLLAGLLVAHRLGRTPVEAVGIAAD
jgi:membrane protease YdiL (CAAX protease family)